MTHAIVVRPVVTQDERAAFVAFLTQLYASNDLPRSLEFERALLEGEHPLSSHYHIVPFLAYRDDEVVGRIAYIECEAKAYVGLYEAIDDEAVSDALFAIVDVTAGERGMSMLEGPFDVSFWLGYRLRQDAQGRRYFGEPYNKPYYKVHFERNGYVVSRRYVSHVYSPWRLMLRPRTHQEISEQARQHHYRIEQPRSKTPEYVLSYLYRMFSTTYTDFAGYHTIECDEFLRSFLPMAPLLRYSMMRFAYYDDVIVGAVVAFPDYGNYTTMAPSLRRTLGILWCKYIKRRCVIMYIGVAPEHRGIGRALVRSLVRSMVLQGRQCVGALAEEKKVTAAYAQYAIIKTRRYELYKKQL